VYSTQSPDLLIQKLKSLPPENQIHYSPYINLEDSKGDLNITPLEIKPENINSLTRTADYIVQKRSE